MSRTQRSESNSYLDFRSGSETDGSARYSYDSEQPSFEERALFIAFVDYFASSNPTTHGLGSRFLRVSGRAPLGEETSRKDAKIAKPEKMNFD